MKFSFPMAWSTWVLNLGFLKFRDAYETVGLKEEMCKMVKWPLKYFLKAWDPAEPALYVQVSGFYCCI